MFSLNHQSTVTAPLIPRRDMEADGFGRDIHANVMFATWLDRKPGRHIRADEIVRLRFLVSRPIRGNQDLEAGDKVAECFLRRRARSFSPIAHELRPNLVGRSGHLDNALLRPHVKHLAVNQCRGIYGAAQIVDKCRRAIQDAEAFTY